MNSYAFSVEVVFAHLKLVVSGVFKDRFSIERGKSEFTQRDCAKV